MICVSFTVFRAASSGFFCVSCLSVSSSYRAQCRNAIDSLPLGIVQEPDQAKSPMLFGAISPHSSTCPLSRHTDSPDTALWRRLCLVISTLLARKVSGAMAGIGFQVPPEQYEERKILAIEWNVGRTAGIQIGQGLLVVQAVGGKTGARERGSRIGGLSRWPRSAEPTPREELPTMAAKSEAVACTPLAGMSPSREAAHPKQAWHCTLSTGADRLNGAHLQFHKSDPPEVAWLYPLFSLVQAFALWLSVASQSRPA